jgi:hypothetical protein
LLLRLLVWMIRGGTWKGWWGREEVVVVPFDLPVFSFGVSCFTFLFLRFKVGGWKNGCKEYILFLMWYFSCFDFCFYHFKIINVYLDLHNLWVLLLLKISIIMKRDERLENSCIIFKYIFWVSPCKARN